MKAVWLDSAESCSTAWTLLLSILSKTGLLLNAELIVASLTHQKLSEVQGKPFGASVTMWRMAKPHSAHSSCYQSYIGLFQMGSQENVNYLFIHLSPLFCVYSCKLGGHSLVGLMLSWRLHMCVSSLPSFCFLFAQSCDSYLYHSIHYTSMLTTVLRVTDQTIDS